MPRTFYKTCYLAFYEHIDSIEEATALSYLYRIAHNKSLTYIKQRNKTVLVDPNDFNRLTDTSKPATEPDYSFLQEAVRNLPPRLSPSFISNTRQAELQRYVGAAWHQCQSS